MPTKIDHTTEVRVHPIKHPKANSCSDFQCYKLLVVQSQTKRSYQSWLLMVYTSYGSKCTVISEKDL